MAGPSSCCPDNTSACCPPPRSISSAAQSGSTTAAKSGGGCCGPTTATPAATSAKSEGCCGPSSAPAASSEKSGGCCGPTTTPAAKTDSGCGPSPTPAKSSCCGPSTKELPLAEEKPAAKSSCCGPSTVATIEKPTNGTVSAGSAQLLSVTHADVQDYYGKQLQSSGDLKTDACMTKDVMSKDLRRLMGNVHETILSRFYGCGSPIPPSIKGATVLDLGCGTGRDVYVISQLVGEEGRAIGVDMTEEQLAVAREFEDWHRNKFGFEKSNVDFRKAFIEDLAAADVADSSVDVVISNCVVNLAPDKAPVLREIARVLKPGGELYFSDVYADRRIPQELQKDKVLFGECLSGALYLGDFRRLMAAAGLGAWGICSRQTVGISNPEVQKQVGPINFYSLTIRALKLPPSELDDALEDYGQMATYNGGIDGHPHAFFLDEERTFITGIKTPVDATTAAMLSSSRYGQAFKVTPKGAHLGPFAWKAPVASLAGFSLGNVAKIEPSGSCC
eukprot:TRINITY_DN3489_c0_g2_i1.p1 TRINITY_DN3489_c0_g2~~TRINITY_DN3489_c0_g2_i1.p1  ORF type:complete len:520 (+),score=99.96 TRINITY_DN3489_c0_g2_i1:50-1561(+)